jgi:hypothetical protein
MGVYRLLGVVKIAGWKNRAAYEIMATLGIMPHWIAPN